MSEGVTASRPEEVGLEQPVVEVPEQQLDRDEQAGVRQVEVGRSSRECGGRRDRGERRGEERGACEMPRQRLGNLHAAGGAHTPPLALDLKL